jgi:Na+-driven multidrug efflux pump
MWKFLSAQSIMRPLVTVSILTNLFVLPICLGRFIRDMGYIGSVFSKMVYQFTQISLLMLYMKVYHPHKEQTWPGLRCWREAVAWPKMKLFMSLGLGGVLAATVRYHEIKCMYTTILWIFIYLVHLLIQDWWFWEIVSALAGSLGVISFSIHTIPAQIINVAYMIPLGIGLTLNVRLAHAIATNVERAKKLLLACYLLSLVIVSFIAFLMYQYRWWIFRSFSNDPLVYEVNHFIEDNFAFTY